MLVVRTRDHMWNRVNFTKRFGSTKEALEWVRADVKRLKSLPATPKGCLKERPRWAVHDGERTILTVDEWGREEAA